MLKEGAVTLSGNTRVALPVYMMLTGLLTWVGSVYLSPLDDLQESFDTFVVLQEARIKALEINEAKTNASLSGLRGDVDENKADIKALERYNIHDRWNPAPLTETP